MNSKKSCIKSLNLPPEVTEVILKDDLLTDYLLAEMEKFPLPPNYIPLQIEIKFNDVLHHKIDRGETTYLREVVVDKPKFMELRFDEECAFFQVDKVVLINRVENLQRIEELSRYIS